MKLPSFIAKRIAFNKERTFSRFIIRIALTATALSVAVMLLAVALVNGFQKEISKKVFDFWGHVQVAPFRGYSGILAEGDSFMDTLDLKKEIASLPEVTSVSGFATRSTILKAGEELEGLILKGVDKDFNWTHVQPYIVEGTPVTRPDSGYSTDILLSKRTAHRLKLKVGDPVIAYFVEKENTTPRARKLMVKGIFSTGISDYDDTYIIGDINLLRNLNKWGEKAIGGYEIFLNDYKETASVQDKMYETVLPQDLAAISIFQIYPNIFDWLNLQNMNEVIILIIMAIVAVINMITAILILILERVNMIGILKSLGMRNWDIQKIFLYQMTYITLLGLLIGNLAGLGLAWLQKTTGFFKLDEETYYLSRAPIKIELWQVLAIDVSTLLICVMILFIPSLIIKKISPVRAVRFK